MFDIIILVIILAPILAIVAGIVLGINTKKKRKQNAKIAWDRLQGLSEFDVSKRVLTNFGQTIFAVDESRWKWAVVTSASSKILNYDDILSVALMEDGKTILSRSSDRTVGGAIAGGLIAGGAGAVIGGLSGDQTVNKNVNRVVVRIVVKNITSSSVEVICHDEGELSTDVPLYKTVMRAAREIVDIVNVIINNAEKTEAKVDQPKSIANSVTDELMKLASLKEKGLLTDEEFNVQKARLLNK